MKWKKREVTGKQWHVHHKRWYSIHFLVFDKLIRYKKTQVRRWWRHVASLMSKLDQMQVFGLKSHPKCQIILLPPEIVSVFIVQVDAVDAHTTLNSKPKETQPNSVLTLTKGGRKSQISWWMVWKTRCRRTWTEWNTSCTRTRPLENSAAQFHGVLWLNPTDEEARTHHTRRR